MKFRGGPGCFWERVSCPEKEVKERDGASSDAAADVSAYED